MYSSCSPTDLLKQPLKFAVVFLALFCSRLLHLVLPLLPILTSALGRRANWFFQDALIKADFISSFRACNFAFICPNRCQKFAVIIFTRISTVDCCLRLLSLPSAVGRYELDYLKWFNPRKLCTAGKRYKSASKWYIKRASSFYGFRNTTVYAPHTGRSAVEAQAKVQIFFELEMLFQGFWNNFLAGR